MFGASRRDLLLKVTLPSAAPAIVASIRITFTRAIEGALLSEFVASTQGSATWSPARPARSTSPPSSPGS